jgi:predicted Zn-dependent protease
LQAATEAGKYPRTVAPVTGRGEYLKAVDGLVYGDSDRQGFARGRTFWHPAMDFTFTAPDGFSIDNQATQVVAKGPGGAIVILDSVNISYPDGPGAYLREKWMKGEKLADVRDIMINGLAAATASFPGRVGGRPVTIRIAVVQWSSDTIFRFQIAIPKDAPPKLADGLTRMINSLRRMTGEEKRNIHPWHVHVVTAAAGDTTASLAEHMPFEKLREERFRVLNGLMPGEKLSPGQAYKTVSGN